MKLNNALTLLLGFAATAATSCKSNLSDKDSKKLDSISTAIAPDMNDMQATMQEISASNELDTINAGYKDAQKATSFKSMVEYNSAMHPELKIIRQAMQHGNDQVEVTTMLGGTTQELYKYKY